MQYRLNKLSAAELTDRSMDVLDSIVKSVQDTRFDDASDIIGFALSYYCAKIAEESNGRWSRDDVLGGIYSSVLKSLKIIHT